MNMVRIDVSGTVPASGTAPTEGLAMDKGTDTGVNQELDAEDGHTRHADGSQAQSKAGILSGWIGTVYAIHPEPSISFDWADDMLVVAFGKGGADLRLRFSAASIGHVLRCVGHAMISGPEMLDDYEPPTQQSGDQCVRAGITCDVVPYCPMQLWCNETGRWVQFGHGPDALTLVADQEGLGWFVVELGDWLARRATTSHVSEVTPGV
jgi:hypothetical protein